MGYISQTKEHEIDSCAGAFMMVRAQVVKKIGGFDEDFFFYGEDLDLCWRAKEAGYKIFYTPITKITHYKGVSSGIKQTSKDISKATIESKKKALSESTRAMKLFYRKHYRRKYPFFVNFLVNTSIDLLTSVRQIKVSI
jgi:GT2 family glycosyltransferase